MLWFVEILHKTIWWWFYEIVSCIICDSSNNIRLSTLPSLDNDLLKDALRLDNELSAWVTMCLSQSVREVQTDHLGWILSFVMQIQLKILHAKQKVSVFLKSCQKISKWYDEPVLCCHRDKICNLQWTNKDPANIFTCIHEHHLRQCPDEETKNNM